MTDMTNEQAVQHMLGVLRDPKDPMHAEACEITAEFVEGHFKWSAANPVTVAEPEPDATFEMLRTRIANDELRIARLKEMLRRVQPFTGDNPIGIEVGMLIDGA